MAADPKADLPKLDRLQPPGWWSSSKPQQLTLLVEGAGLSGARVSMSEGPIRLLRTEEGLGGRALFLDVEIPAGAAPGQYGVELSLLGGNLRIARPWVLSPPPTYKPRPINHDDVIYLIMPDRFANGDPSNDEHEGSERMLDRHDVHAYHGGDFAGLTRRLPYLADLGVTALWLTPVYKPAPRWFSTRGSRRYADFHGYSPVDFYDTNPRFGSRSDYLALVTEAHRLGMKVIQDHVIGYIGPQHHWLKNPPARSWITGPVDKPPVCTFRFDALVNPHATDADRRGMTAGWFLGILPDLNTSNPRVRQYAIQQSLWWTTQFEADGIRLDTYPMVERSFWRDWWHQLQSMWPGMRVVGEAWTNDPAELCFFQGGRTGWDKIDPGIDMLFDFPLNAAIHAVFSGKAPVSTLSRALSRDGLYPRPDSLVTFLDNHDTSRLISVPGVTPARLRLAIAFLLTTRGVPQLTWGDELGLPGHMDDRRDFPGGFPDDSRNAFEASGRTDDERALFDVWRTLIKLRRTTPALHRGRLTDLAVTDTAYVYLREHDGKRLVVGLNLAEKAVEIPIPGAKLDDIGATERIYGVGTARVDSSGLILELPPESAAVFRL